MLDSHGDLSLTSSFLQRAMEGLETSVDEEFQTFISFQSFVLFLITNGAFPENSDYNNHSLTWLNKFSV